MVVSRIGQGDSSVLEQIPNVVDEQDKKSIIKSAKQSYVDGGKIAIAYTGIFLIVSFFISFTLPEEKELIDLENIVKVV